MKKYWKYKKILKSVFCSILFKTIYVINSVLIHIGYGVIMKIKVYTTINNKNKIQKFHLQMLEEYVKRLGKYSKCEVIFGNKKVSKVSKNTKVFIVSNIQTESSENLAENINDLTVSGVSEMIFVYNEEQIKGINCELSEFSVSTMNFSEETSLCVLLEQVYRSYKILNNESYHK